MHGTIKSEIYLAKFVSICVYLDDAVILFTTVVYILTVFIDMYKG